MSSALRVKGCCRAAVREALLEVKYSQLEYAFGLVGVRSISVSQGVLRQSRIGNAPVVCAGQQAADWNLVTLTN